MTIAKGAAVIAMLVAHSILLFVDGFNAGQSIATPAQITTTLHIDPTAPTLALPMNQKTDSPGAEAEVSVKSETSEPVAEGGSNNATGGTEASLTGPEIEVANDSGETISDIVGESDNGNNPSEVLAEHEASIETLRPEPFSPMKDLAAYRSEQRRAANMREHLGVTLADRVDTAIGRGLTWLAKNQTRDGRWIPFPDLESDAKDARGNRYSIAVTSLALLAFASNGSSHIDGVYKDNVKRGLEYILASQQEDGCFYPDSVSYPEFTMLNHALAMRAVAEFYLLTHDGKLVRPLAASLRYLILKQQDNGGWDTSPEKTDEADVLVTTWAADALAKAAQGDAKVPGDLAVGILIKLNHATLINELVLPRAAPSNIGRSTEKATVDATAMATMARIDLGFSPRAQRILRALANIEDHSIRSFSELPDQPSLMYAATRVMFECGGEKWQAWKGRGIEALLMSQLTGGSDMGGWSRNGPDGRSFGATYVTALNTLSLQVSHSCPRGSSGDCAWVTSSLVSMWRDAGEASRDFILNSLMQMGAGATPAFQSLLPQISDPIRRDGILQHMARVDPKAVKSMATTLWKPGERLAPEAVGALMAIGEAGLEPLASGWQTLDDAGARRKVLRHLLDSKYEGKGAVLRAAMADSSSFVQEIAATRLAETGSDEAIPALLGLSTDTNPYIRQRAFVSLVKYEDRRAWQMVVEGLDDPEAAVRQVCLNALRERAGKDMGYRQTDGPEERATAVRLWREWVASEVFREDGRRR